MCDNTEIERLRAENVSLQMEQRMRKLAEEGNAKLRAELADIRDALAGEDYTSLPSDFPTARMARTLRADYCKFREQVIDTCARAEKAESELAAIKRREPVADEYSSTDFGFTFAGVELTEGDKRLMAMLVMALGTNHPAIDDMTALIFRAACRPPVADKDAERYRWLKNSNCLSYISDTGPSPSTPMQRVEYALEMYGKQTSDMIEIRLLCYHLGPHDEPIWIDGEHFDYAANMDAAIDAAMAKEKQDATSN